MSDSFIRKSKVVWLCSICNVRCVRNSQIYSEQTRAWVALRSWGYTLCWDTLGGSCRVVSFFFLSLWIPSPSPGLSERWRISQFLSNDMTYWNADKSFPALLHKSRSCEQSPPYALAFWNRERPVCPAAANVHHATGPLHYFSFSAKEKQGGWVPSCRRKERNRKHAVSQGSDTFPFDPSLRKAWRTTL